jgi:hypothetical protein
MDKLTIVIACLAIASSAWAADSWQAWPPHDYLVRSLVEGIPRITKSYHPETGRFGTDPWVCADQNHVFPLAVAWGLEDDANPYYHSDEILEMIARGGEALVDAQDEKGQWTFRKKDNSTWGQTLMPWTYSRWIRAFAIVRDALPEASRAKWEQGLLLGYGTLVGRGLPRVHNIPTHHAMSVYIAGECFENEEWKAFATEFMSRAVDKQPVSGPRTSGRWWATTSSTSRRWASTTHSRGTRWRSKPCDAPRSFTPASCGRTGRRCPALTSGRYTTMASLWGT